MDRKTCPVCQFPLVGEAQWRDGVWSGWCWDPEGCLAAFTKRQVRAARAQVLIEALTLAEAALSDIGDSDGPDRDGNYVDRAWLENRARKTLPGIRAALKRIKT